MGKVKAGEMESSLVWAPQAAYLAQPRLVSLDLCVPNEAPEAAHVVSHTEQGCLLSQESSLHPLRELSVSGGTLQVICTEKRI